MVTLAAPADAAQLAPLEAQRQRIATLHRALLVIHSPDDEVVSLGNARVIFEAARHPKSFISLDGATPYDLVLAGLGACTAITVRMYADRKGWPLRRTTVRLRHRRIHAKDCASCETRTGQLDQIERELQFEGELTDDQRARLLDIAERCPFIAPCIPRCSSQPPRAFRTARSAKTIMSVEPMTRVTTVRSDDKNL